MVFRRRLFWKIYLTLLASLVATALFMSMVFWFVGEAQRDASLAASEQSGRRHGPYNVSLYGEDGQIISSRGRPIDVSEAGAGRHWGPRHVMRIDLPDGRFVLTRLGPPARRRALRILTLMLVVAGSVGVAAYPVTARLTRRLERLRAGMNRWGETATPIRLDERGSDEVALLGRTFNAAARRIESLLASQKALLANASHELRSPLARLRVAVEVGLQGTKPALHAEIVRNLAEMDQLVGELLLSSRLDHAEPKRDRWDTVDLLGLGAEEAARYEVTVGGEPTEIVGDAVLLRRMIRNLLENAAKHGRPPITLTVSRQDGAATIIVSDSGNGIPLDERERIFEPFYRPAGSGEAAGGWGLGLALVRQIAELHQGSVACDSPDAGGSRFTVRLGKT